MGILSDLKKALFGAESVGKSAVEKGVKMAQKKGEEVKEKAEDLGKAALEKTSGLRDAILHQAEGTIDMVNKSETLKKVATKADQIGHTILTKGEELIDKGSDVAENIGEKILGPDNENLEKAKAFTEKVGEEVLEAKEKMVKRANEVIDDLNSKIDETLEKAKAEEQAEQRKEKKDLHEVLEENEGPMVSEDDDFFAKAEKFAEGDYSGVLEGTVTIQETGEVKQKEPAKAAGFTDHDGDGNEVVDDAIILDEEE